MFLNHFHFDGIAISYLLVGIVVTLLTAVYGRRTLRSKEQISRFYCTLALFCAGYGITIFSGDLKILFAGWEIMGFASFLLIILHRNITPGNTLKAFFIYRLGDVGLLLAMWASHHLWHENTTFVSLLLVMTASAQASQLPVSAWLPQAMENSSTAGNMLLATLAVQMGIFLLLRTMPLWEHQMPIRVLIALLGTAAAAMAAGMVRVQTVARRRIAYASMTHTGLIFVEVAAGFKSLALAHFAANALLRAYQLVRSQECQSPGQHVLKNSLTWEERLPKKLQYTLYMLYMKEWGMYARLSKYLRA
ncbi:hypothetical protein GCM10010967_12480 [Dyadobacter beijingensis]|uniref:NADH:quinone oxidoreductase/Mrp antiporter transmembrane domain-containing protein n=1 Tax=Dyadobacter beijingensis TaxID=365489 RepID=A0ABQ2HKM2_9BACT|nr:proton-conducting transporter membrane subunit [Dyadobacter beijingensis]GGM82333.1 hypothetical protein GCM10010967_12480 [Dyadobacter beijingensis]